VRLSNIAMRILFAWVVLAVIQILPDSVRWAHFCEVTSANFVFGAVVAWLWSRPRVALMPVAAHAV